MWLFGAVRRMSTSSSDSVECVVIGAGVIGLACARALALAGKEVVILERANHWGTETSSRHSEVIHAGLYYPPNSLKAKLCVQGKHMLYDFCAQRAVPHRRVTKLVVACNTAQIPALRALQQRAAASGVTDLHWLSGREACSLEPQLTAAAALLSPSTGVIDSHTYMSALLADAESAGATLAVASHVTGGCMTLPNQGPITIPAPTVGAVQRQQQQQQQQHRETLQEEPLPGLATRSSVGLPNQGQPGGLPDQAQSGGLPSEARREGWPHQARPGGMVLEVQDLQSGERTRLHARMVVNAAGLWAQQVSQQIKGIPPASIPKQYLARGVYFTLGSLGQTTTHLGHPAKAKSLVQSLAAHAPSTAGLPSQDDSQGGNDGGVSSGTLDQVVGSSTLDQVVGLPGAQPFPPSSSRPFSRLIYPLPVDGGLGVHLTLDMGGAVRFGPDVEWVSSVDYSVDPRRAYAFYSAIRTFWPGLPDGSLHPGYAGVRPKLSGPGQPAADFVIQGEAGAAGHGMPGLVCLYGIESPGLTSSLAIAERVRDMLLTGKPATD